MTRLSAWAAGLLLACVAVQSATIDDHSFASDSRNYEHDISLYEAVDPSYPPALKARLRYATYLTQHLDSNCTARLDLAEKLRVMVASNVATTLVLPDGAARLMQLRQAIAARRAQCVNDNSQSLKWREEARLTAESAIPLYAAIHEYADMAVMQFNVAFEDHELGHTEQALEELRAAIDTDRLYGLREDAEDNFRYLERWQGREATDLQLAELINTFASRAATLTFAWTPVISHWSESTEIAHVRDGKVLRSSLQGSGTVDISAHDTDFLVSMHVDTVQVDGMNPEQIPDLNAKMSGALAQILSTTPAVRMSSQGEFKGLENVDVFIAQASAQLAELPGKLLPESDPRRMEMQSRMASLQATALSKEALVRKASETVFMEVGLWSNATLTQNLWGQVEANLSMPGTFGADIAHELRFEFAGWVACEPAASDRRCVELLCKAEPKDSAVQGIHDKLLKNGKGALSYWSTTTFRVVVDPATLRYYARDTGRYSFLALGSGRKRQVEITADLDASSATYGP